MMKKQLALTAAIAAALCTLSIAARADEQRPLTREEVVAQVLAARQSGELYVIESGGTVSHETAAPVSREKVLAELMAARQSGELYVIESGGLVSHEVAAPVSREKVIAEFLKTRQAPPDALAMENSL